MRRGLALVLPGCLAIWMAAASGVATVPLGAQRAEGRPGTMMPYAARLTLQQLLDVVAFLKFASGDRSASVTLADVVD
jgi:hypothetical protein